jgi:hypothetical protein
VGFANHHAHILVDSLAILFSPTGESSLSSGRAGFGAMGTSDERGVLFSALYDDCNRVSSGTEWDLPEVTQII